MPLKRKSTFRPRRRYTKRRGMAYRPRAMVRYNKVPSFVETFKFGDISTQNAGGVFTTTFSQIPQWQQYAALYKQYRINSVKIILIPDYNEFPAMAGGVNAPRLVYAVSDSANQVAPAGENDVLTDNGCRIRTLTRPITMSMRPVPYLQQSAGPSLVSVSKRNTWISTTEAAVTHGGIQYWITGGGAPDLVCRAYAKVSFSLKDGN